MERVRLHFELIRSDNRTKVMATRLRMSISLKRLSYQLDLGKSATS